MCDRPASPSSVECLICDRNVNKRELEDHIIRQHIRVNLEHFTCRICSIARDSREEIIEHVTIAKHLPRENIIRKKRDYAVKLVERIMSDCFELSSAKLASKSSDKCSNRPSNHKSDDHHHQRPPSRHEKDRNGKVDDRKHRRRRNDENDRNKKKRSSLDKEDEKEQRDSSHHRRGQAQSKSHERPSGISEHRHHEHHHHRDGSDRSRSRSRQNDHISADRRKLNHIHSHDNVVAAKPLSSNKHDRNHPSSFDDRRDKTTSDRDNHSSSSNNNNQRRTSRPPLIPIPSTNSTTTSHRSTTHADPSLSSTDRYHRSSITSRGGGKKADSEGKLTDREIMRQAEIVVSESSTSISQTKAAPSLSSTASDIVFDSATTASAQPSSTSSSGNWLIDRCGIVHQPVGRMDQQILNAQNWTIEKQRVAGNDGEGDRGKKRSRCDVVDVRRSRKSGKTGANAANQPSTLPISTTSTNQQQQPEESTSSRQWQKRRSQSFSSFPSADHSGGSSLNNNNNHTEISANSSKKQPSSPDNHIDSTPADGGSFEGNKRQNNKKRSFSPTSSSSAFKINNQNNSSAFNDNSSPAAFNLNKSSADLTNSAAKQSTGGNDQNPKNASQSTSSAAVMKNNNRVQKEVPPKHTFFQSSSSSSSEDSSSDEEGGGNDRYLNGRQTAMVPSPSNDRNLTMVKCKLCPNELPIKNVLNQKLGHVKSKHLPTLRLNCQFCPYSGLMGDDLVRHMDLKHFNRLGGRSQQASLLDVDERAEILKSFKACFPHSEIPPNSRNSVRPNDSRSNAFGSGGGGTPEIGISPDSRPTTHVTTADRRRKDRKRPHPLRKDSKSPLSDSIDATPPSRQSRSKSKSKDDDQSSKAASPPTNVDAVVGNRQALKNNHQLERRLASLSAASNSGQSKSTGKKSSRGDEESSDAPDEGGVHCNQCQAVVVDLFVARKKHTNEAHFNGEEQTSSNLTICWSTGFFELFRRCWPEDQSTKNMCALCRKNVESKSGKASHVARYHYQKVTRLVLSYKTCGSLPGSDAPAARTCPKHFVWLAIKCPVCEDHEELFTSEMLRHIVDEHEGLMQNGASGQTIDVNKRGMYRPPQTWTDGNNLKISECFPRREGPYHYRRTTTKKAQNPCARLTKKIARPTENLVANGPSFTVLPPLDFTNATTEAVARNVAPAITANIAAESSAVPMEAIGDSSSPPADAELQSAETTKRHRNRADQVNRERMEWKRQQQNERNRRNSSGSSSASSSSASGKKRRQKLEEKAALSVRVGGNKTLQQEPDLKIVDEILEIRAVQAILPGHCSVVDEEISVIHSDTNAAATASLQPSSSSGRLWGPPGSSSSVSIPVLPSSSAGKSRTRGISTSKSGGAEVSGYCKGCGKNFDKDLLENHHLAYDHIWANHMNFISAPRVCTLCPFRAYSMNHITAHLLSQHSIRVMVGKDADSSHSKYRTEMSPDETLETQCQLERCFGLEWDESGQRMIRANGVSE